MRRNPERPGGRYNSISLPPALSAATSPTQVVQMVPAIETVMGGSWPHHRLNGAGHEPVRRRPPAHPHTRKSP